MNAKHVELLQRLEEFQLDSPGAALPYSSRLARENNWAPAHAQRVVAEYKRFAFLAVAAGHPVSPSEDVDQAWHLHLTYSQSYWKVFCPDVLGKPLHHQPTQGGETERDKFNDWYARTLESYETFFGGPPPGDIWPSPEARRKESHNFVRVDLDRSWVIPKPRLCFNAGFAMPFGLAGVLVFCSGAMLVEGSNVFDWRGPDFLTFYVILFAVCFGLALWVRRNLRVPFRATGSSLPELDAYAIAFLNGGKILAVNTAIANLANQKAVRVHAKDNRLTSSEPKPPFGHELERLVYAAADAPGGNTIANVRLSAKSLVAQISDALIARGLVMADAPARKAIWIPLLLAIAPIAAGVIKIVIGLSREKPVGILVGLCIASGAVSLLAFARRPLRSRYGDAVLEKLQDQHRGSRRIGRRGSGITAVEFATVVGLFGMTALAGTELSDLRKALQPPQGNGGGCGSSCGAGCGGGCGGCGGD